MFNKFKKPKTNIVSLMIYFFLLFYVGSVMFPLNHRQSLFTSLVLFLAVFFGI